jgi:actin-like ATPase involved in cell morphogenesis
LLESTTRRPAAESPEPGDAVPGEEIRLGIDFGTSTTLVAARIGARPPRVISLERGSEAMPSYIAVADGTVTVGQAAMNAGASVHSVKLRLRDNQPIPELNGMEPSRAAFEMIREAVWRTLEQLKRERRLPPTASKLTVATNIGCTPAFTLNQRVLLRDICRSVGLDVVMANLIEEPVAAGFEMIRTAGSRGGRTLVIDIGGGTLDVAVMDIQKDGSDFVIYATGGRPLAGDDLTRLIEEELKAELARRRDVEPAQLGLTRQEATAIWLRAEEAKRALSTRPSHRVALPGGGDEVSITREWFETKAKPLVGQMVDFVTAIYRQSRLTLDRGGPDDPYPGEVVLKVRPDGSIVEEVTRLRLDGDGLQHIDSVYLVGGAGQTPIIQRRFREIFGDKLQDTLLVDPVQAVVLGLARHENIGHIEMRHPNWGVLARLSDGNGRSSTVSVYEPYATLFQLSLGGNTSTYKVSLPLAQEFRGGSVVFEFRPLVTAPGAAWEPLAIPAHATSLDVRIDLFGRIKVTAGGVQLKKAPSPFTPKTLPKWILGYEPPPVEEKCWHGHDRGQCPLVWCPGHFTGGVSMSED